MTVGTKNVLDVERELGVVHRLRNGAFQADVARDLNVSPQRISQIVQAFERRTGETVPRHPRGKRATAPESKSLVPAQPRRTEAQRLLRNARLEPETGCWHWLGRLYKGVYPHCSPVAGEQFARRASYRLWRGPIPKWWAVVPRCPDSLCINPYHLETVPLAQRFRESDKWDHQRGCWAHGFRKGSAGNNPRKRRS